MQGFDTGIGRPLIVALVSPREAPRFTGKVDEVVAKPLVLEELLNATDRINSEGHTRQITKDC